MNSRWIRIVFWTAVAFTFVMATLPHPPRLPGEPSDKIQHIAAFIVLSTLGAAAYRNISIWRTAISLSCFGALIEIVQAIPALHRDSDIRDWLADTIAVAVVLGGLTMWRQAKARRLRSLQTRT